MATTVNSGRDFFVQNVTVSAAAPTPVTIEASALTTYHVSSVIISCRTSVALQLTRGQNDGNFFTIPAGGSLTLSIDPLASPMFYLQSQSGSVTAEILLLLE